ncbi:DUF7344 domain-containing protein [Natrinema halophilum]|uniref:DUF7344 domain-containing protein n=1 Tax=Natrinema halophilum TaxID=1699371 RepID=A0A7D5GS48_9EURY|nr:hypothetical protein [Natrinema halophilum]QLG48446.1 hypothetical protein HYG82_06085 [Natrinema halophilum]
MTQSAHDPAQEQPQLDDRTEGDRHRLLAAKRRRLTLDILAGMTGAVELVELAAGIVAREDGIDGVDDETVSEVTIALHHVHLPVMAEFGIIDYDPIDRCIKSCPARTDAPGV